LALVPGLDSIAEVIPVDRGLTPASHFTFAALFGIRAAIDEALGDAIDGVVVVQGTDTIEETAFFFDLLHASQKPVVVTGAMRSASAPDYDGPANLRDAVAAAASPALRDAGVVVVLAGSIEPADDVTKTHASAFDTFRSLNAGSLGRIVGGQIRLDRGRGPRRRVSGATRAAERVHLVTATVAMDGTIVDALLDRGTDGLVVEATGAGNTSAGLLAAASRAIAAGIPVVLTTRCPAGAASDAYAFPGGGATWVRAGALMAGHLGGPKARVALAVGLGAGLDRAGLAALLADPAPLADGPAAGVAVGGG
ncbi:MAG TPA: asparaginase, partial [Candidatus Limnocylindrales bacterium]|nr:asparaginase [Candidatus Limnocylindrales bacterium]